MIARKAQAQLCKLGVCLQQSLQEKCSKLSSHLHVHRLRKRSIAIESGAVNNFHVIVKQITMFDGRKTDEVLVWDSNLRFNLKVYNKTIFNVLREKERPSEFDADQEATRATWDAANHDLCSVSLFPKASSVLSDVRRFQGKTPAGEAGQGQQAWVVLCEKFNGCLRAAF